MTERPSAWYLPDLTRVEVADAMARGVRTIIIPLGATEQHGPHAPFSTDTIVAEEVSLGLGARLPALVAPVLAVTYSPQHLPWAGSMTLTLETLQRMLLELLEGFAGQGFRRLLLLSGHGGNREAMLAAAHRFHERRGREHDVQVVHLLGLQAGAALRERVEQAVGKVSEAWEAHAGEQETSMVLARDPRLVRMERAPEPVIPSAHLERTRHPFVITVTHDLAGAVPQGSWGAPRRASAEQGERTYEAMVELLLPLIRSQWEAARDG